MMSNKPLRSLLDNGRTFTQEQQESIKAARQRASLVENEIFQTKAERNVKMLSSLPREYTEKIGKAISQPACPLRSPQSYGETRTKQKTSATTMKARKTLSIDSLNQLNKSIPRGIRKNRYGDNASETSEISNISDVSDVSDTSDISTKSTSRPACIPSFGKLRRRYEAKLAESSLRQPPMSFSGARKHFSVSNIVTTRQSNWKTLVRTADISPIQIYTNPDNRRSHMSFSNKGAASQYEDFRLYNINRNFKSLVKPSDLSSFSSRNTI